MREANLPKHYIDFKAVFRALAVIKLNNGRRKEFTKCDVLPRHINSSRYQFDSTGHHQQHLSRGRPCPLRNASFDPFNDVTREISRPGLFSVSVAAFCPSPSLSLSLSAREEESSECRPLLKSFYGLVVPIV